MSSQEHNYNASDIDAVQPYSPLLNMVTFIVDQMLSISKNATCNEKICTALLNRVEIAQRAVKSFELKYHNINEFAKEITQMTTFQKFMSAKAVKGAYEKNIKEFEEVFNELNFTMTLYGFEQREIDAENLAEDLVFLKKTMNNMKYEIRSAIGEVTTLISSQKYNDNAQQIHNNKASHLQGELNETFEKSTGQTQDVIAPFVPIFNMVTDILNQMSSIYENAKRNEKICAALLDRVKIAEKAVSSLQYELQANEENFRNKDQITSLKYFQNFINANAVKKAYEKNIKEFEKVYSDLNFTITMYDAEQREQKEIEAKNVAKDFEILEKVL
ncbi:16151_t:CDS:2 [Dentiscutata erythropus]|uniref:16151_t:CDS:1 n=1 Tax=Dentiscutata erythropus TaxID=1348616 RepID=A0A9N9IY94_9GLOM|nr:16151_t:CDS:2 [Dentiscutata erythropus]